jgi:hypothetical protein
VSAGSVNSVVVVSVVRYHVSPGPLSFFPGFQLPAIDCCLNIT